MIYTFTENDIAYLGITDETIKTLLLKTSIVDSSYDGGLEMYTAQRKTQYHYLGGVDVRSGTNKSTIVSLMQENNRTKLTIFNTTQLKIASEKLSGVETYDVHYTYGTIGAGGGSNSKASNYTIDISSVTQLNIKGRSNIFGIIYDGDKTLTYGDKSITIEVYDDNGLTVKGQKGVKGIIYNGTRVKELMLNGTSHIMKDKIICNGVELPVPPNQKGLYGDGVNHWAIRDDTTTGYYDLYYASTGFGYYNNAIYQKDSNKKLTSTYSTSVYRISKTAPTNYWVYNNAPTGGFEINENKPLIASSDNILSYSSMDKATTDVYFAKTHDN